MASPDEIWSVDFGDPYPGEPAHHRPAVIVGPSPLFGNDLPFVIVVPLTTSHRGLSFHVEVEPSSTNGLDATSYVQCELIRSISKQRLRERIGIATQLQADQISTVLRRLLDY